VHFLQKAKFSRSPTFRALSNRKLRKQTDESEPSSEAQQTNSTGSDSAALANTAAASSDSKSAAGAAAAAVDAIVAKAQKSQSKLQSSTRRPRYLQGFPPQKSKSLRRESWTAAPSHVFPWNPPSNPPAPESKAVSAIRAFLHVSLFLKCSFAVCSSARLQSSIKPTAPRRPGVFVLTDDEMTTYYYVEACDTLRIAIANTARGAAIVALEFPSSRCSRIISAFPTHVLANT